MCRHKHVHLSRVNTHMHVHFKESYYTWMCTRKRVTIHECAHWRSYPTWMCTLKRVTPHECAHWRVTTHECALKRVTTHECAHWRDLLHMNVYIKESTHTYMCTLKRVNGHTYVHWGVNTYVIFASGTELCIVRFTPVGEENELLVAPHEETGLCPLPLPRGGGLGKTYTR